MEDIKTFNYLQFYTEQPLGKLSKKFSISPPSAFFLFSMLAFGLLVSFQFLLDKTPLPNSWQDLFKLPPPGVFYYPNLWGLCFDLLGVPFIFFLAIWTQEYLPNQIQILLSEKTLTYKPSNSLKSISPRKLFLASQIVSILIGAIICAFSLITAFQSFSGSFSLVLASLIGAVWSYSGAVFIFDYVFLFWLLNKYDITPQLRIFHPDGCGGLKPFGEFAKIAYYFLFTHIMLLIVLAASNDSFANLRRINQNASIIIQLLLAVVFFPLASGWLAYIFLVVPHQKMEQVKQKYLDEISKKITKISENIANKKKGIDYSIEARDDLIRVYEQISDIPSWSINKDYFKSTFLVVNPLFPAIVTLGNEIFGAILKQFIR